MMVQPSSTAAAVRGFYVDDGWPLADTSDDELLQTRFRGDSGEWTCFIEISDQPSQVVFHSVAPIIVPPERRLVAAELVARLNDDLAAGNFDLTFESGEIRYRTSVIVDGGVVDESVLRPITYLNVGMMDRHLAAIMLLASSQLDAESIYEMTDTG